MRYKKHFFIDSFIILLHTYFLCQVLEWFLYGTQFVLKVELGGSLFGLLREFLTQVLGLSKGVLLFF